MQRRGFWKGALVLASAMGMVGCGTESGGPERDTHPIIEQPGPVDPVEPGAPPPDGGTVAPPGDGGTNIPVTTTRPPAGSAGWTFYGVEQGGPVEVLGVTADQGGNIWVAGGEEGLFLLEKGATQFRKFTMADGLRPYGYMPDGSEPPGEKYLKVISVSGGPAGTVFVGYEGKRAPGRQHCESEWDGYGDKDDPAAKAKADPSVYKSGDADKVTLAGAGISVVHYDIFSGPGVVKAEMLGREKLCDVKRIVYDATTSSVWFGANHGFARGDANFRGDPTCNGKLACSGVEEHMHPFPEGSSLLSGDFLGVAPDSEGNVWVGGDIRSTKFKYVELGGFWRAQVDSEGNPNGDNHFDLWKDAGAANKDVVSAMAVARDGTVWASSYALGVARLGSSGNVIGYLGKGTGLPNDNVSALAADPLDTSVWVGASYVGGLTRIQPGEGGMSVTRYGMGALGALANMRVSDIQQDRSQLGVRRLLVGFTEPEPQDGISTGAIGIYTGS